MIEIDKITTGEIDGTGSFDKFMQTVNLHIEEAVNNNTITQEIAGQTYVGIIPGLFDRAINFEKENLLIDLDIQIRAQELKNLQIQESALKIEAALSLEKVPANVKERIPQTIIDYVEGNV